ncbi:MAG: NUDIX domain-containing protein [Candidatus Komeilibacteria bacterium]|nr:NUDIX domain-containing protein [Candidatus Komeilibacteria bacterium]
MQNPEQFKFPEQQEREALINAAKIGLERTFLNQQSLGEAGKTKIKKNEFGDTALRADIEAEEKIIEALKSLNIPLIVVSEEHGRFVIGENPKYLAVLDGLDGTAAYIAEKPQDSRFGTMLGIFKGDDPTYDDYLFGGVMEQSEGKLYFAEKGSGSFVKAGSQTERIQSDHKQDLNAGEIIYVDENFTINRQTFSERLGGFKITSPESSAVCYTDVAEGKVPLTLECTRKNNLEIAAAFALLKEAGGDIVDLQGNSLGKQKYLAFGQKDNLPVMAAANGKVLKKLLDLLAKPAARADKAERAFEDYKNKAKLLVKGEFSPADIEIKMTDHRLALTDEQLEQIEKVWAQAAAKGFSAGPLARVEDYQLTPEGKLAITFGQTDYKEFLGTRDQASLRKYGYDHIANPLVTSSVIITGDNKLLIARRETIEQKGDMDAIGGHIDPEKDLGADGKIDIFAAAKREVSEEAGLNNDEMRQIKCLGLSYQYADLSHLAASFAVKTNLTYEELKKRRQNEIILIEVSPERLPDSENEDYVMAVLKEAYPNVDREARITIALARQWLKGEKHKPKILRSKERI